MKRIFATMLVTLLMIVTVSAQEPARIKRGGASVSINTSGKITVAPKAGSSTEINGTLDLSGATVSGLSRVTSVGLTLPSFLSVSGSPVTSTGSLAATLATQAANRIFAGPATGADAAPTFRAIVANDLPSTLNNTTIPNLTVSGTLTNGTATWTYGAGAPTGACVNGSIYTRTDATGGLYLCKNTAWVEMAPVP